MAHKRSFPQQWKDDAYTLGKPGWHVGMTDRTTATVVDNSSYITNAAFGADLFVPVNGYQKTMRSVKYSVLCILLTFSAFFLIETTNKRSVHPFQYGLIGLALVLFYILLLSFFRVYWIYRFLCYSLRCHHRFDCMVCKKYFILGKTIRHTVACVGTHV